MDIHQKLAFPHVQQRQKLVKGKRSRKITHNKKLAEATCKVVYISTPMKVTTSASKFRETVQELTGRESDVVRIMDSYGGKDTWMVPDDDQQHHHNYYDDVHHDDNSKGMMISTTERSSPSTTSSDELVVEPFDGVFVKGQDSNFGPLDHMGLLLDGFCHQIDMLGPY